MAKKRKLQVFVSSTFEDLKEERQAAVQAILTSNHIPAGMELFSAGDQSQMDVIRRWIDESDVYLLLLGGRYGSIELTSGKSYTQIEYEYALEKGKALFALVITADQLNEKVKAEGIKVIERDNQPKLDGFRALVTSKLVKFWNDKKDIQLAILQTLSEFDRRDDLIGWIPGSETINTGPILEELTSLAKENAALRNQLSQSSKDSSSYNGLAFHEVVDFLDEIVISKSVIKAAYYEIFVSLAKAFSDTRPVSALHFFCLWGMSNPNAKLFQHAFGDSASYINYLLSLLVEVELIEEIKESVNFQGSMVMASTGDYYISAAGKRFLLRMKISFNTMKLFPIIENFKTQKASKNFDPFLN